MKIHFALSTDTTRHNQINKMTVVSPLNHIFYYLIYVIRGKRK